MLRNVLTRHTAFTKSKAKRACFQVDIRTFYAIITCSVFRNRGINHVFCFWSWTVQNEKNDFENECQKQEEIRLPLTASWLWPSKTYDHACKWIHV